MKNERLYNKTKAITVSIWLKLFHFKSSWFPDGCIGHPNIPTLFWIMVYSIFNKKTSSPNTSIWSIIICRNKLYSTYNLSILSQTLPWTYIRKHTEENTIASTVSSDCCMHVVIVNKTTSTIYSMNYAYSLNPVELVIAISSPCLSGLYRSTWGYLSCKCHSTSEANWKICVNMEEVMIKTTT